MNAVFVTNFMNHHQKPLWDEFIKYFGDFKIVAYSDVPKEQRDLGYHTYDLPYLIQYTDANAETVDRMILDADVVIFGTKPQPLFQKRLMSDKMNFIFSERLFKKRANALLHRIKLIRLRKKYLPNKRNIPVLLCAGAYVENDFAAFGYPARTALKWGYFPEISMKSAEELRQNKSEKFTLLWVGRFLDWKHPERAVEIAAHLKSMQADFHLKMIGSGEMFDEIEAMIRERKLNDVVEMTGARTPEEVKAEMEKAHVFLMTSDRQEGWGAVVNEAMSCACTVLATAEPGCIPYLIKSGVNGMVVDAAKLPETAYALLQDPSACSAMGGRAFETIHNEWNGVVAAKRLAEYIHSKTVYEDGPLSYNS
ncbi:MAG: glycosyltransferase [Clostridia bacterium]|nr:glycosyltransferase [Clostridia bacterium]